MSCLLLEYWCIWKNILKKETEIFVISINYYLCTYIIQTTIKYKNVSEENCRIKETKNKKGIFKFAIWHSYF